MYLWVLSHTEMFTKEVLVSLQLLILYCDLFYVFVNKNKPSSFKLTDLGLNRIWKLFISECSYQVMLLKAPHLKWSAGLHCHRVACVFTAGLSTWGLQILWHLYIQNVASVVMKIRTCWLWILLFLLYMPQTFITSTRKIRCIFHSVLFIHRWDSSSSTRHLVSADISHVKGVRLGLFGSEFLKISLKTNKPAVFIIFNSK